MNQPSIWVSITPKALLTLLDTLIIVLSVALFVLYSIVCVKMLKILFNCFYNNTPTSSS